MIISRAPAYIVLLLCLITVYSLFYIKDSVITIRTELIEVNKQAQYEIDTIHLLKAELAYLSSPERLKRLSDDYLKLTETRVAQMVSDPLSKEEKKDEMQVKQLATAKRGGAVKWVYKNGASKYFTLVSKKK